VLAGAENAGGGMEKETKKGRSPCGKHRRQRGGGRSFMVTEHAPAWIAKPAGTVLSLSETEL